MKIVATCECGFEHRVPAEAAGKRGRCRQCGRVIVVPIPPGTTAPVAAGPADPPDPRADLSRQDVRQLAKAFSLWRETSGGAIASTVTLLVLLGVIGLACHDLAQVPVDPTVFPPLERTLIAAFGIAALLLIGIYVEIGRCAGRWENWSARWFGVVYLIGAFVLGIGAFAGTIVAGGPYEHILTALAGGALAIYCAIRAFSAAPAMEEFIAQPGWSRDAVFGLMKPADRTWPLPGRGGQAAEASRRTQLSKGQLDQLARTLRLRRPVVQVAALYQVIAWILMLHVAAAWLFVLVVPVRMKGPISLGEFLLVGTILEVSIAVMHVLACYGTRRSLVWVPALMMSLYLLAALGWAALLALAWAVAALGAPGEARSFRPSEVSLIVLLVFVSLAALSLHALLAANKLARQPAWCRQAVMGK